MRKIIHFLFTRVGSGDTSLGARLRLVLVVVSKSLSLVEFSYPTLMLTKDLISLLMVLRKHKNQDKKNYIKFI